MDITHKHDDEYDHGYDDECDHGNQYDDQHDHIAFPLLLNQSQDREISTYLDPNVSVTPMAESHRSMGDTVYFWQR